MRKLTPYVVEKHKQESFLTKGLLIFMGMTLILATIAIIYRDRVIEDLNQDLEQLEQTLSDVESEHMVIFRMPESCMDQFNNSGSMQVKLRE